MTREEWERKLITFAYDVGQRVNFERMRIIDLRGLFTELAPELGMDYDSVRDAFREVRDE